MSQGIMYMGRPAGAQAPPTDGAKIMEYVLLVSSLFWPRLFLLGFWFFGSRLGDAFSSWVIPVVGFLVLPWTTLAYALMWGMSSNAVSGWEWIVVAAGILLDGATMAGGRAVARS